MRTRLIATATTLVLLTSGTAHATGGVQQVLDELTASGAALGVQARVTDGRRTYSARSGVAVLGTSTPVPLNGSFRIGSVTKTFVATVVLQLAGEGRVDLDAPVDHHLPGLVDRRITVRQLLQHTSGLYSFTKTLSLNPDGFEPNRYRHWDPEELVAIATSRPLDFDPGTRWSYSNTNYVVAALLIERLTGRPYARAVEQRVLNPLRLTDTELPGDRTTIRGPHARGYWTYEGAPSDITRLNPSVAHGAGEMISTTRDLDTFVVALTNGQLLKPAQRAELARTTATSPDYGLGVQVQTLPCGQEIRGHSGSIPGYLTFLVTTPDAAKRLELSITTAPADANPGDAIGRILTRVFC